MTDIFPTLPAAVVTVEEHTAAIRELCTRTVENVVQIGEHLIAVRTQLPHGQFEDWLKQEFGWGKTTAQDFMRISKMLKEQTSVLLPQFDISALCLLSYGNTPESVREAAFQQAASGEKVTHKVVEKAIAAERAKAGARPARGGNGTKPARGKRRPAGIINPPYQGITFPTAEETGAPGEGATVAEHDAHSAVYGRVQLHPKTVKDMLNCDGATSGLVHAILSVANPDRPDAERFFASIDQMLAWAPKPGKTNGEETDFARKARATMRLLRQVLPVALPRLQALAERLEQPAGNEVVNA